VDPDPAEFVFDCPPDPDSQFWFPKKHLTDPQHRLYHCIFFEYFVIRNGTVMYFDLLWFGFYIFVS